jgi:hypothetical protein
LLSRHLAAQANDPERLQFWNVKAQDRPVLLKAASDSAEARMRYQGDYGDADSERSGGIDIIVRRVGRGGSAK